MPVVETHLIEGYDADAKRRLAVAITDAVRIVIPAPPEAVTVMIHEHSPGAYYRGGVQRTPAPALPNPAETVRAYLAAMEARELDRARAMLAEGFEMRFPGAAPMRALEDLIAWAKPRYRFVTKTYEGFDTAPGPAVFARGTLSGEWPDGRAFEGIRFIDRFELDGPLIARQDVWNDIGETLLQEAAASSEG